MSLKLSLSTLSGSFTAGLLLQFHRVAMLALLTVLLSAGAFAQISLVSSTVPNGTIGQPYTASLMATGGTGPYTYILNSGSLPTGLTLSTAGVFAGTPQTAGLYGIALLVRDSASASGIVNLSLQIPSASGLAVTSPALPAGNIGTAYDFTFAAGGGSTPYSFDIVMGGGSLPGGLSLTSAGRLSGTPTTGGIYPFTLRVTDAGGNSFRVSNSLRINSTSLIVATNSLAGATLNVPYSQSLASLGGTAPYLYTIITGTLPAGLTLSPAGLLAGTPTAAGTSTFTVRTADSAAGTAQQSFTLIVSGAALQLSSTGVSAGTLNTAYNGTFSAQGGTAPYTYSVVTGPLPAGLTLSAAGVLSGTPTAAGVYPLTVRVTDSSGATSQLTLNVTVNAGTFTFTNLAAPAGTVGTAYSFPLTVSGGTTPITYAVLSGTLPAGLTLGTNGAITGTPTTAGTANLVIRATDSAGLTAQTPVTITVGAGGGNSLSFSTSPLPAGTVGTVYTGTLSASNGASPYTYSLLSGTLPPGLTLGTNGNISGTPTASGTYQATFRVTDANAATAQTTQFFFVGSTGGISLSPVVLPSGRANQAYTATLTTTGGTGPYTYQVASGTLPAGLTLSAAGVVSGTPTTAGASTFSVRATDTASGTTQASYTVNINAATGATVTPATLTNGQVGTAYTATLAAAGGTSPYTFAITAGALPPGLSLSSTGAFSGTPTTAGTYAITYSVTDASGAISLFSQSLTVGSSNTISFGSTTVPPVTIGTAYANTLTGTGGTAPYTFTVATGTLPAGLTLSAGGALAGTATTAGSFPVTLRITDAAGATATGNFTFVVSAPGTGGPGQLALSTSTLNTVANGQPFSQSLVATGGTGPYTFSIVSGTLPAGLTLSGAGVLSGSSNASGSYPLTVRVTDAAGATAQSALTLAVSSSGLIINGTTLPEGVLNRAYSATLFPVGGSMPFTFALLSGSLPAGVTFSSQGVFSGTPTAAGAFPVVLRVTDSTGAVYQQAFTINIRSSLLAFTGTTLPSAFVGSTYLGNLQAAGGTQPYTFTLLSGTLPAGLAFSTATGTITGTPTSATPATLTFQVTDAAGNTATNTVTITPSQSTLQLSFMTLPNATVGQTYLFTPTATGGTGPYVFAATAPLPAGLFLTPAGAITGTPTQAGTFNITVRGSDSTGAVVTTTFPLTIVGSGFQFTNTTLPAGTQNQAYNQSLTTSGGAGTVTYTLASGNLPAGLTLSPAGGLTGTPTVAGSYTFTIRATDANAGTTASQVTVVVNAPQFGVTTQSLPSGLVSQAYNQTLAATGGTAPYTYRVTTGTLPAGLTLSSAGVLSGTPTAVGSSPITVTVTDATGRTATRTFTVGVGAAGSPGINAVVSAANYAANGVAPGELVVLFGSNLGPAAIQSFTLANNTVATTLGGTRVLFDGTAAPIVYTSASQIAVIVPFSVAGRTSTMVTVEYQGVTSLVTELPVLATKPAIFTANASGTGAGAVLNQNGSLNSTTNAAAKESIVTLYLTGAGVSTPALQEGQVISTTANLSGITSVTVNGAPAMVQYAGNAPGLLAGVSQINVKLPAGTRTGSNAIVVTVGNGQSAGIVTVEVQ